MDDGVQWEQSPMYHNEVLRCLLEVLRVAGHRESACPVLSEKARQWPGGSGLDEA
ncbi:MAG: hypothetical protein ACLUKO_19045 [Enterocloster bolteae]